MNKPYIKDRINEASTWRGLVGVLTAFGIVLSPDQVEAIVATGLAIAGLIGAFFPDQTQSG